MTDDQERMIDKVMKLLAKAESTTPEEAELLSQKANELMQRYVIDDAMLAAAGKIDDEIIEHRIRFEGIHAEGQQKLAFSVGDGFGFKILSSKYNKRASAYWVGWKRDIEKAEVILASLLIQQARSARVFMKDDTTTGYDRYVAKRSFLGGFAEGVRHKMMTARREAREATPGFGEQGTTGRASVVLYGRDKQITEWFADTYKNLRYSTPRAKRGDYGAEDYGYQAGKNADTGSPRVSGSKGALKK